MGIDDLNLRISLKGISFVGTDLARPECVLSTRSGDLYVSDRRGGITWISPSGKSTLMGRSALLPNGIAIMRDSSFLVANLADEGGVWRLKRDGTVEPFLMEIEGQRLPSVNFVWIDRSERLWICVSTIRKGIHHYRPGLSEGFLAINDHRGTRIVADNLCWTNECRISRDGACLYVNETFGRRLTKFNLAADGSLSGRCTVTEFGPGTYPDGMEIDSEGCVWIVSVVSNRVIRVSPDGRQSLLLEDLVPDHVERLESAFQAQKLTRTMVWENPSKCLRNLSSIAFGGPDLRTVYVGCISGSAIATFRSPISGLEPPHWAWT